MITRVTSSSVNETLMNRISSSYANYSKLTEQISSGKRVNSIMDDAIESVNIIDSKRELGRIDLWKANIGVLNNEIKQSSETIDLSMEKGQRAKDLAATAANGTSTLPTLNATMAELNQLIETMVDSANTNYNGNYIYGGTNTKTPPYEIVYEIDSAGNPTKEIAGIKYTGTPKSGDWERELETADGVYERLNVTGDEAFGQYDYEPIYEADGVTPVLDADGNPTYALNSESGIFSDLMNFKNSLQDTIDALEDQKALPPDASKADKEAASAAVKAGYDSIHGTLDGFDSSLEEMTTVNASFGTTMSKLEMSTKTLTDSTLNLKEYVSGIEDLDLTKAVSEWYSAQQAYQASMQATTSSMSMSLLNYM